MRPQNLNHLFDELTRSLWRGRLPKVPVIRCPALAKRDGLGRYVPGRKTGKHTVEHILILPQTPEQERLTLIHEMCHHGTRKAAGYGHGPVFLRMLSRVAAQLHEPSLMTEVEDYDGTRVKRYIAESRAAGRLGVEIPFKVAVRDDLEGAALAGIRHRWPRLRDRWLAEKYHMSPAEFDRAYPDGRRQWEGLVRDQRALTKADEED